jgi:hypothetical protein
VEFKIWGRHSFKHQGLEVPHIVVARADAVIIRVADVHFHVLNLLVEQAANALGLVECALVSSTVAQRVLRRIRTS